MPPKSMPSAFAALQSRKRGSSPLEVSDYDEKPAKKARTSKPKKAAKDVGTCSLIKKEIGDRVKSALRLEKYEIQPMRFDMKMDTAFFRSFFLNNDGLSSPLQATPATFDDSSPVVVVDLNHREAGELLGGCVLSFVPRKENAQYG